MVFHAARPGVVVENGTEAARGEELGLQRSARKGVSRDILPGCMQWGGDSESRRKGEKRGICRWLKARSALKGDDDRFTDKSWRRLSSDILNTFSS